MDMSVKRHKDGVFINEIQSRFVRLQDMAF